MKKHNWTRRSFLKTAAASVTVPLILPRGVLAQNGAPGANGRVTMGCIGVGKKGSGHAASMARNSDVQVLAICDVKPDVLERSHQEIKESGHDCAVTPYYEEVLERDDIDTVLIATPDHWHAALAIAAMKAGKDVYVEKPMTLTPAEGRAVVEAERRYARVLQVGSQQRSDGKFRRAAELVRNGWIGDVKEVYVELGEFDPPLLKEPQPLPDGFDYDRWLGPAPYEEYFEERVRGSYGGGWRRFWDYGSRKFGDWGAHHFDIVQWALGRDDSGPVEFVPAGFEGNPYDYYVYDDGVKVVRDHPETNGFQIRFIGSAGEVLVDRGGLKTVPASLKDQPPAPGDVSLYLAHGQHRNWLECVKSRQRPICPASVGHRTGTVCQVAAIAKRLGRRLRWDPVKEEVIDDPAANRMLDRPRRAGYELPA